MIGRTTFAWPVPPNRMTFGGNRLICGSLTWRSSLRCGPCEDQAACPSKTQMFWQTVLRQILLDTANGGHVRGLEHQAIRIGRHGVDHFINVEKPVWNLRVVIALSRRERGDLPRRQISHHAVAR